MNTVFGLPLMPTMNRYFALLILVMHWGCKEPIQAVLILIQRGYIVCVPLQMAVVAEVLPTIRKTGSFAARQTAYEELNRLCLQEKVSKDKGTFHSLGMHRRKYEKHLNAKRIQTCKENLQIAFKGFNND